jgi:hypothetical protein
VPGIFNLYELVVRPEIPVNLTGPVKHTLGFNLDGRRAIGLFGLNYMGSKVGVLGCVGCHSGRAAGQTFIGLGNKNIDVGAVGRIVQAVSKPYQWTRHLRPEYQRRLIDQAMKFTKVLGDKRWTNRTQGLVPVSMVRHWFYEQAGEQLPDDMPVGGVKVAHLWGYGEKRKAGLFCDGFGDGKEPGWATAVELAAGQHPETVRAYMPRVHALEALFEKFLPPPYPFAINKELAAIGQKAFESNCSGCHGTYRRDAVGLPIFAAPRLIPIQVVGTDRDRLNANTPRYRQLVATSPLKDLMVASNLPEGYFAPRLDGIWARFPYFHNNAIPNLRALLTPPAERPRVWSLYNAGERDRYDEALAGLTLPTAAEARRFEAQAKRGERNIYWVERVGHSNQGHPFGTGLPDDTKRALIEYLKTL